MKVLQSIGRYFRLLFLFIKYALQTEMEYRINFLSGILVECGYFLVKLAYVYVAFRFRSGTDGLEPAQVSIYVGTFTIVTAFFMFFWPSFLKLSALVQEGGLDVLITKPVDLQFMLSLRYLSISMIFPNLLGGTGLLIYGWYKGGYAIKVGNVAGYILFVLLGVVLIYSLFLIPKAFLSFWFLSSRSADVLVSSIWEANNMPMSIYSRAIRFVGIYLLPVFLIANYPSLLVSGGLGKWDVLWEVCAVCLAFGAARWIFNKGIRHYESASS